MIPLAIAGLIGIGGAFISWSAQARGYVGASELLQRMDVDKNGTVSPEEFEQYQTRRGQSRAGAKRTFRRLDVNQNGQLEVNELRPLVKRRR